MTTYAVGEIVDITIKGARVRDVVVRGGGADLTFTYDTKGDATWPGSVWADAPAVTVERVAPAAWPPQPGDLWRDKHGVLWFASLNGGADNVMLMRSATGNRWSVGYEGQLVDNGPWMLVYREPEAGSVVSS